MAPAFAAISIPKGGLEVFVFDYLESHRIEAPGRLEVGDSGYDYRVRYRDQQTSTDWSRLTNMGEELERAVRYLRLMKTSVLLTNGKSAAALPYRIIVDFSDGTPRVSLAVRYYFGAVGEGIAPIESCSDLAKGDYPSEFHTDSPDWRWARVLFKGTNRNGWKNRPMTSIGRLFFYSGWKPTELVPEVDFVFSGTNAEGADQNQVVKLDRHEAIDAFTLFNFDKPLLVEHPKTLSLIAVTPKDVVVDLQSATPRVLVRVRTIGANLYDFDIPPSAMKGLANVFCASALAQ